MDYYQVAQTPARFRWVQMQSKVIRPFPRLVVNDYMYGGISWSRLFVLFRSLPNKNKNKKTPLTLITHFRMSEERDRRTSLEACAGHFDHVFCKSEKNCYKAQQRRYCFGSIWEFAYKQIYIPARQQRWRGRCGTGKAFFCVAVFRPELFAHRTPASLTIAYAWRRQIAAAAERCYSAS